MTAASEVVLAVRDVEVPGRLTIDRLDVRAGERLLVTGPNGAGKSSLLAVLARRLEPVSGVVHWGQGVDIGLLEQDVHFAEPQRTPRQLYEAMPDGRTCPALAALGLLAPRDLDRSVGVLSVGQRRRLALALLVGRAPEVLLLDEPTNHISLTLAEELEEAIRTGPATTVIATHDRWLRRGWQGPELRLDRGALAQRRPGSDLQSRTGALTA